MGNKMKKGKRIIKAVTAFIMSMIMAMSRIPGTDFVITAYADSDKTITGLCTGAISNPTSGGGNWNVVFYGHNYTGGVFQYFVLDRASSDFGGNTMLLLNRSRELECRFDDDSNNWADSEIKGWLNGSDFLENSTLFSNPERQAIAPSTKASAAADDGSGGDESVYAPLNGEKIFLLDAVEATRPSYGFQNTSDSDSNRSPKQEYWWLRSAAYTNLNNKTANYVLYDGSIQGTSVNQKDKIGDRAAFNLNLEYVMFSSHINNIGYKLTIKDDNLSITPGTVTRDGTTITVPYTISGSNSANATQVSVLITDSVYTPGKASTSGYTYQELNVDSWNTSGSGTFTLPSEYSNKTCGTDYYAYILAEDVNGEKETDYASAPVSILIPDLQITKEDTPTAVFTATGADSGTLSSVTADMKYSIDGGSSWTQISGTSVTISSGVTVTNGIRVYKPGNGTTATDSDVQTITVAKASEPTGLIKTDCTMADNNDGTISGVTAAMEYKKSDASGWTAVTGSDITGLVPGTYYVRVKATDTTLASDSAELVIAAYSDPTPIEQVATPTFSPAGGTYNEAQSVSLSCATDGADIYYTTDGTDPTTGSTKYTGAINISSNTTIKAIAVKSGMTNSEVATATYTILTAPAPHEHSYTSEVTTTPTCTEKGIRTYTCSCGDSYTEEIPAQGHDYTSVITTQPTIFTEGVITYTCTRCGHSYTDRVPKVDDGEDKSDLIKDVTDDNGNTKAEVGTKTNEDGSTETTVTIGGQEVEKIATDANGNETVETSIWIGGLKSSYTYTGSAIKPSFHVYDGTKKLSSGKDYSVSFKNNKNAGATATITISFKGSYKGTSVVKLNFDIISLAPEAKDNKHNLSKASVSLSKKKYDYTGKEIIPAADTYTLKLNGKTLKEGEDFTVSVTNNVGIGTATILFSAKQGNAEGYGGTKTATFRITGKKELKEGDGFTYSYSASVPYAKGGAKPAVIVKDGDDTLKAGTDYTVSYSKNTKVTNGATAVITINGKGDYKGSIKKYFTITKQDISKLAGNIITADKVESKKGYNDPTVTITDLDGKKLKAGTDFAIVSDSYSEPDTNGVVTATVSGKGNYTGTASITYRYIKGAQQLGEVKVMKSLANKTYTGREARLTNADLTGILYIGSKNSPVYLIPGTDFKVISYANNTKTGTAKVTIQGIGAYGGTRTLSFKIIAKKGDIKGSLVGGEWQ